MRSLFLHLLAIAFALHLTAFSVGCANSETTRSPVSYDQDTLVIRGVRYERQHDAPPHARGALLLESSVPRANLETALVTLGLRISESYSHIPDLYVVAVPEGFETHWVLALRQQPEIKLAHLNRIVTAPHPALSNPPIESMSPGTPGAASHVKR
jgi:hypothetical protein